MADQVVLVTGVSSGIGRAIVERLSAGGYRVYGTTRNLKHCSERAGDIVGAEILEVDITQDKSVDKAVHYITGKEKGIDVLINNAGYGLAGPVEDTSIEEAQDLFDVNFFGVLRMIRAVVPIMRRRRSGLIINMSSIVGLMGIPFQALYCGSKYAIEGFSESLRMELKNFGIRVVMVEPGDVKTGFTDNRVKKTGPGNIEEYRPIMDRSMEVVERDERNGYPADKIALLVASIIRKKSPQLRYPVGKFEQMISLPLKKIVPGGIFESIIMQHLKL